MNLRLLGAAFVLIFAASPFVNAAVFNCAGSDTACLINSIDAANANGEDDTINLESVTYILTVIDNFDTVTVPHRGGQRCVEEKVMSPEMGSPAASPRV